MNRLIALAAMGCVSFLSACNSGIPVDEREKTMLLRAADLVPFGYGLADTRKYETFNKTRYFDGSMDIVYEHETPETEQEHPLYLNVTVTFERKASDAIVSAGAERMAFKYALKAKGVEMREVPNFYAFGDSSDFHMIERDGKPFGNHFSVRQGARVYTVVMTGIYFDDVDEWKSLIGKKLELFSAHSLK